MLKIKFELLKTAVIAIILFSSCATGLVNYEEHHESIFEQDSLFAEESDENINGLFPEKVYIKSRTQTFNSFYEFQIYHGRIFYKSITGGNPDLWTIFKGKGLPSNIFELGFKNPKRIVAINADSNELYALSDEGIFYHISFGPGFFKSNWTWEQKIGWPDKTTLQIDQYTAGWRSWALSRRGEEVLWYEDINGNQHHYGTIGIVTNYILMNDGQEIKFADPGLPSDFSHNILGPERGRFIAESISASASTIFLINSAGEMYTRLADFDTVGSDPMFFKYTYDRNYKDERPGSDYATNFNPWALPSEEWKKQPEIRLIGKAAITDRITILQNGQGNQARELRVAGFNPAGNTGYFFKKIDEKNWKFKEAPMEIESFLDVDRYKNAPELIRGISPDRSFNGRFLSGEEQVDNLKVCLENFNLFEGSGTLKIMKDDEVLNVDFFPVEMWYYLKRKEPGRDGTPKLFMVTIDIPEDDVELLSEPFRTTVNDFLMPWDLKTFGFTAEAANGYLSVESVDDKLPELKMFFQENEKQMDLNPELVRRFYLIINDDSAVKLFSDGLAEDGDVTGLKRGQIIELIQKNLFSLDTVERKLAELESQNFSCQLSNYTYSGLEKLLNLTGLYRIDYPKIFTITMYSGTILEKIMKTAETTRESNLWMYSYIREHLMRRVKYYESILRNENPAFPFYESPVEYFKSAGLDFEAFNFKSEEKNYKAVVNTDISGIFPVVIISDTDSNESFLLEFLNFEEAVTDFITQDSEENDELEIMAKLTGMNFYRQCLQLDVVFRYNGQTVSLESKEGEILYQMNL